MNKIEKRARFYCRLSGMALLFVAVAAYGQDPEALSGKRMPDPKTELLADSMYHHLMPQQHFHDKEQLIKILQQHEGRPTDLKHIEGLGQSDFEMHYLVFPLRVAIVVDPARPDQLSLPRIRKGIEILNRSLSDAWIQFKTVRIDTIYAPVTINSLKDRNYEVYYAFSIAHDLRDTISLYLVDNEENLCEDYRCARTQGFSNILETYTNNVVIDKFFVDDFKVMPHEFGHYFGLLHTAETVFGLERVDGGNCTEAGDRVCDTPADPGEVYGVYVNYSNCEMKGLKEAGTGLEYHPMINNYMSYYAPCYMRKFYFTPGQLDVIFYAAVHIRPNQIIELGEVPEF
ncbi:MAG: M43 family zinc metalloprotease [Saprospiraceae bacterium]